MCGKCKDYVGRCGVCGADLVKGTRSEPIGKPVLPPRRPPPLSDLPSPAEGDNPPKASAAPEYEGDGGFEQRWRDMFEEGR